MTLDEAIKHCEEVADEKINESCNLYDTNAYEEARDCVWFAEEHRQLAEWLKDYKRLKEHDPCEDIAKAFQLGLTLGFGEKLDEMNKVIDEIKKIITPQPKTGHWAEENINGLGRKIFCSECGCSVPFEHVSDGDVYSSSGYGVINKTKFCPNCGADMRGE